MVKQELKEPIFARKVRFHPIDPSGYTTKYACMRVEIYGCDPTGEYQWSTHVLQGSVMFVEILFHRLNIRVLTVIRSVLFPELSRPKALIFTKISFTNFDCLKTGRILTRRTPY